jgi:hypothetical protein
VVELTVINTISRDTYHRVILIALAVFAGLALRCDDRAPTPEAAASKDRSKTVSVLDFPTHMRVEDPSVNDFVGRAMAVAAAGEYEPFRLLWTARHEPMSRDQYEEGWQATRQIRVRALEPAFLVPKEDSNTPGENEKVYLILAEVRLDPKHPAARREPKREAVLMIVREQGRWRLAQPLEPMRDWIREKVGSSPKSSGPGADTLQP